MPPKPKPPAPSKKADQKKKEKVIEDKTFGLKNKKGAKQQRFIQQVEKQVKSGGIPPRKVGPDKKEEKLKEAKELNMIFKPVQKIDKDADPKSILCAFFKFGQCAKGNKCKFSHDLTVERKAEKRSLYVDARHEEDDTMENWTEDKLKEVVEKKHGEAEKKKPTTDIICKYFIDAVERSKYGWFWSCPNGADCIYRHALPSGFVLQKDRKQQEEKKDTLTLEEVIESERLALKDNCTKLTLETFLQWKKRKIKEKQEMEKKAQDKKRMDYKAGHHIGLSGREMFSFNPELAADDMYEEGDEVFDSYARNEDEDDANEYHELDLNYLSTYEELEVTNTESTQPDPNEIAVGALNEDLFLEDIDENGLSNELNNCKIYNGEN